MTTDIGDSTGNKPKSKLDRNRHNALNYLNAHSSSTDENKRTAEPMKSGTAIYSDSKSLSTLMAGKMSVGRKD